MTLILKDIKGTLKYISIFYVTFSVSLWSQLFSEGHLWQKWELPGASYHKVTKEGEAVTGLLLPPVVFCCAVGPSSQLPCFTYTWRFSVSDYSYYGSFKERPQAVYIWYAFQGFGEPWCHDRCLWPLRHHCTTFWNYGAACDLLRVEGMSLKRHLPDHLDSWFLHI